MAIEYAIVLPLLLTFALGLMDTGRILWTYITLSRAVDAASRCASVNAVTCGTISTVEAYAAAQAWGMGLPSSDFVAATATCGTQVTGTLTFQYFSPWFYAAMPFTNNQLKLTATACYPS
jgi:Flp pilus assembly protein TadG